MIFPKRFIRVWLGPAEIPPMFETWWEKFREMHPTWELITIRDAEARAIIPNSWVDIYKQCSSYAMRSDLARLAALDEIGGVYVDTDVMPLRPFDKLVEDPRPFAAKRTGVSFENAVLGSPPKHPAMQALVQIFPKWYADHADRSATVSTGAGFISSIWFGRGDVRHLPAKTFYPYSGFYAPKRPEKLNMFSQPDQFPPEMLAAHFSNSRWGGKPKS